MELHSLQNAVCLLVLVHSALQIELVRRIHLDRGFLYCVETSDADADHVPTESFEVAFAHRRKV